ncbi:MAG: tRNA 2-thiouridine(34) synthase MnmA [Anaerolineales bacterium]|nr:tRNA 2-thiouridine(34) synthase MnmA [Anaerolineales bacterium]
MQPIPPVRVVVAMSGGVDSSVAAALFRERGHDVAGVMLRLWTDPDAEFKNRCCDSNAVALARRIADQLKIPFHLIDAQEIFRREVVAPMIAEYSRGRTPNPCLACNRSIRWGFMMRHALGLGADRLATGHYARIRETGGGFELLRGIDHTKDQSYVLASLGQADLARTMFPLGGLTKAEVRTEARRYRLPAADRPDSQDLCFVSDSDYRRFLKRYAPESFTPGPILNREGQKLGEHQGLPAYTIGQRKGIRVSASAALYALEIDPARNALIVGPREALGRRVLRADTASWIRGRPPAETFHATVKIRYTSEDHPADVAVEPGGGVRVRFDHPLRDITPGQSAVFYDGELCLGAAVIAEAME